MVTYQMIANRVAQLFRNHTRWSVIVRASNDWDAT